MDQTGWHPRPTVARKRRSCDPEDPAVRLEDAPITRTPLPFCIGTIVLVAALVAALPFAGLQPQVDESFFFSASSEAFREHQKIAELFPSFPMLLLACTGEDIDSAEYGLRIDSLTVAVKDVPGVLSVQSVSRGPGSVAAAKESPLWRRVVLAESAEATILIAVIDAHDPGLLIRDLEAAIAPFDTEREPVEVSGVPWLVEMIRRRIVRDFVLFNGIALLLFGALIAVLMRSVRVTLGATVTCLGAVAGSLLIQRALGIPVGILTANLSTVVFIVCLSHLIYMAANWRELASDPPEDPAREARNRTFSASFWCMVTTLFGFLSLLLVEAKPLRQLGASGSLATAVAMAAAYVLFPPFLAWAGLKQTTEKKEKTGGRFPSRRLILVGGAALVLVSVGLSFGLGSLDTDPSLLSYFAPDSDLYRGLEFVDRQGGSSPLQLVVEDSAGARLDDGAAFERLLALQDELEDDPAVGTILSLPIILAEADRNPLASLLSWSFLVELLSGSEYDKIAQDFITEDRKQGRFLVRMVESTREGPRGEIIERLRGIVVEHGFVPALIGGSYRLQASLAAKVAGSLVEGLLLLLVVFSVIAAIVARAVRPTVAMVLAITTVPLSVLGVFGWLRIPMDIISVPAANFCVGLAVDAMVHLVTAARRRRASGMEAAAAWREACRVKARPVLTATAIVVSGFLIFALSGFPPTQRFGLAVVFGTTLSAGAALFLLPLLAAPLSDD